MLIDKALCIKCEKCIIECPNKAIRINGEGEIYIDRSLCTDCIDFSDIECIRVCDYKAITREDGTIPEIDRTPRLLSGHIPWAIAIIGDRGLSGRFPVDNREWGEFRKLIAAAIIDPDLKIRIVYGVDDICISCPAKQTGCREAPGSITFERLGLEPGAVIRFWDAVRLVEDNYSTAFLKERNFEDIVIDCICKGVTPGAKILTN